MGDVEGLAAEKIVPEARFSTHAEGGFERVAVAEIVGLFGQGQFPLAALQADGSARRRQQARDQPQQRGLAGAVAGR